MRLPVIAGFGGVNAAGRSSLHHAYRRMVVEALPAELADHTWSSLAGLTGNEWDASARLRAQLARSSLVRRIEPHLFDVDAVPCNRRMVAHSRDLPMSFSVQSRQLPEELPASWRVAPLDGGHARVEVEQGMAFLLPTVQEAAVKAAGQLPSGFEPGELYPSRNHPRGLQMTVFAASDALANTGVDWQALLRKVPADQISVYAGSGMGQLDANASGGMVKARANGRRVTSKHCPFGFAEMPADFINAYVLGSIGATGTNMGACASFLYNLRQGIHDIQGGRSRIAIVGNSEAPITPEVMEGYAAMGALASDKKLRELDGLPPRQEPDYRRACRPFGDNCGFTIAESAQVVVLFDDELALEAGASVYGSVIDVFVNADGHKKSISAPGVGNYVTMAKAAAAARALLGESALRRGGFVQAHGTGTPQNRVTESHILNEVARSHGIEGWPVAAVKAYLGHSIGAAAADQLVATLGIWEHGLLPGIRTIDSVADDVSQSHLSFAREHRELESGDRHYAIVNAKGFGGNNASAALLSPSRTLAMLGRRHGAAALRRWRRGNEALREAVRDYDRRACAGDIKPVYKFDHGVLGAGDVELSAERLRIPAAGISLDLTTESPYSDMAGGER